MKKLPAKVLEAWPKREGPCVLTTVSANGMPNTVYVTNLVLLDDSAIAIADCAFDKTRANILRGSPGNFLFLTQDAAYQLKGAIEYHRDGPLFDGHKAWAKPEYPVHAVALFKAVEAWHGADRVE